MNMYKHLDERSGDEHGMQLSDKKLKSPRIDTKKHI